MSNKLTNLFRNNVFKYSIYLLIVLGLTTLSLFLTFGNNYQDVLATISKANIGYIFLILGIVFVCIILRSLANLSIARIFMKDYEFHRSIALDQNGVLYRMVTPAGIGGHIMEMTTYKRQGVRLSDGLAIIALYSIVYQIALITYNIITLIVKGSLIGEIGNIAISFSDTSPINIPLWVLISIGFLFNILTIVVILLLSYSKRFFKFVDGPIFKLLIRLRIIKRIDLQHQRLENSVSNFRKNLTSLLSHWPIMIITLILLMGYITISYSVPYFAGLAFNNTSESANFFDSVLLSNFHQMVTSVVPLPGGSLVSELFFLKLFYPSSGPQFYMNEEVAKASLILWRSLMYIFPLLLACLYTILYIPRKKNYDLDNE